MRTTASSVERWVALLTHLFIFQQWAKGTNIFEGPGVNVARIPHNGRNFEYLSGEDPVLGSKLLPRVVDGVQKNAMAIVKHYIAKRVRGWRQG